MKLSEAMRKGCEFAAKGIGFFVSEEPLVGDFGMERRTCAFGAAAHGMLGRDATSDEIHSKATALAKAVCAHDRRLSFVCTRPDCITAQVMRMNDARRDMSREEIADWLEERGL